MKTIRKKLRKIIKESIHGSRYYKMPPKNPRMHIGNLDDRLKKNMDVLINSEDEEDKKAGFQLAAALQQKDLVIPLEGEPYEDMPYKGLDYVDDMRGYKYQTIANYLGDMYQYLSNDDLEIIKNVQDKNLSITINRDGPAFMFDNREYGISDDELEDMLVKIAAKKKKISHLDINNHLGMPSFDEAYFKILPELIKISKNTYVSEYELDDLGIGHFTGKTLHNGKREIVFSKPEFKSLYDIGKLIIQ